MGDRSHSRLRSFILVHPTVWPQYTNVTDRTDGQRSDSAGRTVLQTVDQKRFAVCYQTVVLFSSSACLSVTLVYCGQTVGRIKMKLDMQVGLIPGHIVLDGDPATRQKVQPHNFRPMSIVAKRLDGLRFNMPLGTEIGLGPCDFVLDGDWASPPRKWGYSPPIFGQWLLWPNGWMHQDTTWYGGRPRSRRHCVTWGLSSP